MNTNFKKLVAGASILALVGMNLVNVNAANIDTITVNSGTTLAATTTITTVSFTPATALIDGSNFTVSYPATINDAGLVFGDIDVVNAVPDLIEGVVVVDTANNTITVPVTTAGTVGSVVTLTFSNAHFIGPASGNISFAVSTSVGDTGAQMVYVANANKVTVNATVIPTLSMGLSTAALNLGTLDTVAYADQTVTVTTVTNATSGADVTMVAGGLKDATIGKEIGVTDIAGGVAQTSAADRYLYAVGGAIGAGSTDMTASQVVLNGTNIANSNAATDVHIGAIIGTTTEAGNYSDTLTFTVTGSF